MDWTQTAASTLDNLITNRVRVPAFSILTGGRVVDLEERLINLTITDNQAFEADTLTLTIDDTAGDIALPARGTELAVAIGWDHDALTFKGVFTVDEIGHEGPPDRITVTARSADFREEFNVRREYSWHDCTVGDVVATIAGRYQLEPVVSASLAGIAIDHADQNQESDTSFLSRMADMLAAVTTIKNGSLLFIEPCSGTDPYGRPYPAIVITRQSGDTHSFRLADRDAYTGVKAYWLDLDFGKKPRTTTRRKRRKKTNIKSSSREGEYTEGAEGNVYVLRTTYKSERAARQAAYSKWQQLQRGAAEFSITLAEGNADLYPGQFVTVTGFKEAVDNAAWVISRLTHTLEPERGFRTQLELELRITGQEAETAETET
ncbi:phage late control D family protein [Escherichia coli]|nr:phage late control D family protein [Escherichia coli]